MTVHTITPGLIVGLIKYLSTKPFDEVEGLIHALKTLEQINVEKAPSSNTKKELTHGTIDKPEAGA
jgi:hypothetical protein